MGASATAYGSWSRSRPLDSNATLSAGSFGLASAWTSALSTTAMWPGETRQGTFRLTHTGNGRWDYAVAVATTGALASDVTVQLRNGTGPTTCGTTVITQATWSTTPLPTGATVYVCVYVTLSATTANSKQGAALQVDVTGTARNQPTY